LEGKRARSSPDCGAPLSSQLSGLKLFAFLFQFILPPFLFSAWFFGGCPPLNFLFFSSPWCLIPIFGWSVFFCLWCRRVRKCSCGFSFYLLICFSLCLVSFCVCFVGFPVSFRWSYATSRFTMSPFPLFFFVWCFSSLGSLRHFVFSFSFFLLYGCMSEDHFCLVCRVFSPVVRQLRGRSLVREHPLQFRGSTQFLIALTPPLFSNY